MVFCEIKFDQNPYGVYYSGQTLSGRIEIHLNKPKKVKGISVRISGKALSTWTETQNSTNSDTSATATPAKNSIIFNGREDYLRTTIYFVGSEVGNDLELPAGLHSYNFTCVLPEQSPTSFEGTHGYIRYTARVVLERTMKEDQSYKVAFTVLKQYDLNYDSPLLRIPTQMEVTKKFWCFPCQSAPLLIVATIPQSGYVCGQTIHVHATVNNMSHVSVEEMKFKLVKTITYYSQTPRQHKIEDTVTIQAQRSDVQVPKRDSGEFFIALLVPPSPPTNISSCQIIHITYAVRVEAKIGTMHINPHVLLPITIGTIPIQNIAPDFNLPINNDIKFDFIEPIVQHPSPSAPPAMLMQTINTDDQLNSQIPIINPIWNRNTLSRSTSISPPSYEESTQDSRRKIASVKDEEDAAGIQPIGEPQLYLPRYPVYRFDNDAQPNSNEFEVQDYTN